MDIKAAIAAAELPTDVYDALVELEAAISDEREKFPPETFIKAGFFQSRIIQEMDKPESEDHHWWESLIYILKVEAVKAGAEKTQSVAERIVPLLSARASSEGPVELREIKPETVRGICSLSETLTYPRNIFVASNANSLAQAHFSEHVWFRGIFAGKAGVGFIQMVHDVEKGEYEVWRFMIAEPFHGRGYGRAALEQAIELVRTMPNATHVVLSYVDAPEGAGPFYKKLGFVPTGEVAWGETIAKLELA